MNTMNDKLSTWLAKELSERGWSARELGRRSGFTGAYISRIIAGEQKGSYDFCAAIASPLGKTPEEVFRLVGLLPPKAETQTETETETETDERAMIRQIYHAVMKSRSAGQKGENPPSLPDEPSPKLEDIIEIVQHFDELELRLVYDYVNWRRWEQQRRRSSDGERKPSDEVKQEEWRRAFEHIDLLLAVDEANPQVREAVIRHLQDILHKQMEVKESH